MNTPRLVERDQGTCHAQPQADGDPGYSPVVYVDRRGNDKAAPRPDGLTDADFSEATGLQVCVDCKKYCEPVLTEHRRGLFTETYFCFGCDFEARVRMLVEDGIVDEETAGKVVHRLIAFEDPGLDCDRVTVVR